MGVQVQRQEVSLALNELNMQLQCLAALVSAVTDSGYLDNLRDYDKLERAGSLLRLCQKEAERAVNLGEQCELCLNAKASISGENSEALSEAV